MVRGLRHLADANCRFVRCGANLILASVILAGVILASVILASANC